jgi:two-component system chemotaxis response regulator CheY
MPIMSQMKVLVVDDQVSMRGLTRYSLQQIGFKDIDDASNGKLALDKLVAKPFDLVISDWNMDVMDGLVLLKLIRQHPQMKKLPFIMVTGAGDKEKVVQAVQAGVNNYIIKPFTVATLKSKIEAVVGKLT